METYSVYEDIIGESQRNPTDETFDEDVFPDFILWNGSDWEKYLKTHLAFPGDSDLLLDDRATSTASSELYATSVCSNDLDGRSDRQSSFGGDPPESDDDTGPVGVEWDAEIEFEDDENRPIQLLVHDSDTSPDTGRASKSDTEAAPSSASTSAGGDRPAGGQILNNESHGTASSEGRDKVVENPSADKGKKARPRKSRKTVKADDVNFEKDSMGYACPIEILEYLHQTEGKLETAAFDKVFFLTEQAATVDEKGRYQCAVRGRVAGEGIARWVETDHEPCGRSVGTNDSYRRHILEAHLGIPRARRQDQEDRLGKRIKQHYVAKGMVRKRKAVDEDSDL
ncbi:SubName: Full=Uncharacterized protein {ECO:0000313/EMBL:CCA70728.1} [Serendipita indica DSM 11827]|nr:SubName: Full=Uncharacterized protein {ECO:0000313/EMBL:CCA70728.1} [Serendipita indica DSM 11827]